MTDAAKVEQTINEVVKDFGKLDVFVANAGMAISKAITETSLDEYRKQMSVNGESVVIYGRCVPTSIIRR